LQRQYMESKFEVGDEVIIISNFMGLKGTVCVVKDVFVRLGPKTGNVEGYEYYVESKELYPNGTPMVSIDIQEYSIMPASELSKVIFCD
jgi:hypothetical protein